MSLFPTACASVFMVLGVVNAALLLYQWWLAKRTGIRSKRLTRIGAGISVVALCAAYSALLPIGDTKAHFLLHAHMAIGGAVVGVVLMGLCIVVARVWNQPMHVSPVRAAQMSGIMFAAFTLVGLSNYFQAATASSSGFLSLPSFLCAVGGFVAFTLLPFLSIKSLIAQRIARRNLV
jgi:hypothetical protein